MSWLSAICVLVYALESSDNSFSMIRAAVSPLCLFFRNPLLKPQFSCVQSLVNLIDQRSAGTGGNVIVAHSHLNPWFPKLYCTEHRRGVEAMQGDDWFALPNSSPLIGLLRRQGPQLDGAHGELRYGYELKGDCRSAGVSLPVWSVASNSHAGKSNGTAAGGMAGVHALPEALTLELAAGDLLMWDSRTLHCSSPGWDGAPSNSSFEPILGCEEATEREARKGDSNAGSGTAMNQGDLDGDTSLRDLSTARSGAPLLRAAVFVCMLPQHRVFGEPGSYKQPSAQQERVRKARCTLVDGGVTTSHWPDKFTSLMSGYLNNSTISDEEKEGVRSLLSVEPESADASSDRAGTTTGPTRSRVLLRVEDLNDHQRLLVEGSSRHRGPCL